MQDDHLVPRDQITFHIELGKRIKQLQAIDNSYSYRKIAGEINRNIGKFSTALISSIMHKAKEGNPTRPTYGTVHKLVQFFNSKGIDWEPEDAEKSAGLIPANYAPDTTAIVATTSIDQPLRNELSMRVIVYRADEAAIDGINFKTATGGLNWSSTMQAFRNVHRSDDTTVTIIDTAASYGDNNTVLARYGDHISYGFAGRFKKAGAQILGRVVGFFQPEPDPYAPDEDEEDIFFAPEEEAVKDDDL